MATPSRNFAEARFSSSKFVHRSGDYTSRSTEKGVASIHLHMCAYNINALWYTKHSIPYQIFKPGTHVHFTFQKLFIILKLQKFLKLNGHHVIPQNATTNRIAFKALPSPCPPRRQPNAADAKLADLSGHIRASKHDYHLRSSQHIRKHYDMILFQNELI